MGDIEINMHKLESSLLVVMASLTLLFCSFCSKDSEHIVPAGPLMEEYIHFQYAIYYIPRPSNDPSAVLKKLLADQYSELNLVDKMKEYPDDLFVSAFVQENAQKEYAPPDMEQLHYFGRGISKEQAEALQKCEVAYIIDFGHPGGKAFEGLRTANNIVETIARETNGILWDEETRETFSPDEWHEKRVASWTEDIPDIANHITIHAYNSGEYVRAITLGMCKIGLPDVVVEDFSWSSNRSMGHLINLFYQAIAEVPTIEKPGEFDLNLHAIKNKKARDPQIETLKENATAVALLSLKKGNWEEGDPNNRLIEISFDRCQGKDNHARQEQLLSSLFGWEDKVTSVRHNEELLAASQRAKEKLPLLYKAFIEGLQPGEYIRVKAPFERPDGGNEWMWVEIITWKGNKIKGLLKNEPYYIPSLHGGQIVEVKQDEVFDYIRDYPDGSQDGNETGKIIQKMQEMTDK